MLTTQFLLIGVILKNIVFTSLLDGASRLLRLLSLIVTFFTQTLELCTFIE